MHVCVYLFIINIHSTEWDILCKQKLLFWMWLITINCSTAQILNAKSDKYQHYNVEKWLFTLMFPKDQT